MSNHQASCPSTGTECPLGIDPVTLAAINGQLGNLNRTVMATREDVVAVRHEVEWLKKGFEEAKDKHARQDAMLDEIQKKQLIASVQWDGPKKLLAGVAAFAGLVTLIGAIASILNSFGVIG